MPLKQSSERERVRSLVLIEARFTQLFHTTKSTLNPLTLKVFLSPPQTTKKKEGKGTSSWCCEELRVLPSPPRRRDALLVLLLLLLLE